MNLFPHYAADAARDDLIDECSGEYLAALVQDHVDAGFTVPFGQWIDLDGLGSYICDARSQRGSWSAISHDLKVPLYVAMAWLFEHRLRDRQCPSCSRFAILSPHQ